MGLINDGHPFLLRHATAVGLKPRDVYAAVAAGALRRVIHRVYADAFAEDTRALRLGAARLVMPAGAVLADEWAGWVYGIDVFTPAQRHQMIPTVLVQHGTSRLRVDGVRCRQAEMGDRSDLDVLDGVHLTSPVRTTSDLLRKKWRPHAMAAADAMAHAGLVLQGDVEIFLARLKGYPGIVQARTLARWMEPLAESAGESWTRLRLLDAGFPPPSPQWGVLDVDGVHRRLDLAYPRRMIAVEYDGRAFHSGDADRAADEWRRQRIVPLGFRFVVATHERVFGQDPSFEHEVGRLLGMEPLSRRW